MTEKDIIELFDYKASYPPDEMKQFNKIKEQGKCFALTILRNTPSGDQQIEAITSVLRACHVTSAAIYKIKKFDMEQLIIAENKLNELASKPVGKIVGADFHINNHKHFKLVIEPYGDNTTVNLGDDIYIKKQEQ